MYLIFGFFLVLLTLISSNEVIGFRVSTDGRINEAQ